MANLLLCDRPSAIDYTANRQLPYLAWSPTLSTVTIIHGMRQEASHRCIRNQPPANVHVFRPIPSRPILHYIAAGTTPESSISVEQLDLGCSLAALPEHDRNAMELEGMGLFIDTDCASTGKLHHDHARVGHGMISTNTTGGGVLSTSSMFNSSEHVRYFSLGIGLT